MCVMGSRRKGIDSFLSPPQTDPTSRENSLASGNKSRGSGHLASQHPKLMGPRLLRSLEWCDKGLCCVTEGRL